MAWRTQLQYGTGRVQTELEVRGNARQTNYAPKYGETETQSWNIVNLSAVYHFSILHSPFSIRGGIENLLDTRYSAYSDWNNIPQKGRNVYLNLTIEL